MGHTTTPALSEFAIQQNVSPRRRRLRYYMFVECVFVPGGMLLLTQPQFFADELKAGHSLCDC